MLNRTALVITLGIGLMSAVQSFADAPSDRTATQATELDLAKPFHTRSAWRLVVTEGPPTTDFGNNTAPGSLTLCLHKGPAGPCVPDPVTLPLRTITPEMTNAWEPHYLINAKIVYPRGPEGPPFLLIVTGSLNSGDGDQVVSTQLVTYDAGQMFSGVSIAKALATTITRRSASLPTDFFEGT